MSEHMRLWGKTNQHTGKTHLLLYHMIDVGAAASALWDRAVCDGTKEIISSLLRLDLHDAQYLFSFWAAIHDIGKATPVFQSLYRPAVAALEAHGFSFPPLPTGKTFYHSTLSTRLIPALLTSQAQIDPALAKKVARALGGHHGSFSSADEVTSLHPKHLALGGSNGQLWDDARRSIISELARVFPPSSLDGLRLDIKDLNTFLAFLSGFTTIADWIGSNELYFPFEDQLLSTEEYAVQSMASAENALDKLGWRKWRLETTPGSFSKIFGFQPYPLQAEVMAKASGLEGPALVILEAPTGIGKTEAALMLADIWGVQDRQAGLYVAMPTMATSNQMYMRVRKFLAKRYPGKQINARLIHGQSLLRKDLETKSENEGFRDEPSPDYSWFLPSKKSLLAPFGVGTVDQSLLSVLRARHFFVRLFGLGRKTIIFDEVHAYDMYMSQLFHRLLSWLKEMGTSVIVLSATLPDKARRELISTYAGTSIDPQTLPSPEYPRLTWSSPAGASSISLTKPESRNIALEWVSRDESCLAELLARELAEGGCAAVICNTVRRAQAVYRAIQASSIASDTEIVLFHARFPMAWREEIEKEVVGKFGKDGQRPKAIVVATQVIEQSLDLDFDLMVSDLAPVDLIIQRVGRLHRHERVGRPSRFSAPRLILTQPALRNSIPTFGNDEYVYEEHLLLRTYQVMEQVKGRFSSSEITDWIEMVYGDRPLPGDLTPPYKQALDDSLQKMKGNLAEEKREANLRLICAPDDEDFIYQQGFDLSEDDPAIHKSMQALTRMAEPSVNLVCLHEHAGHLFTEPGGEGERIDPTREDHETVFQLMRHSVSVSKRKVVMFFNETLDRRYYPLSWQKSRLMKHHRLAVFASGTCKPEGAPFVLMLDHQLGLEVKEVI